MKRARQRHKVGSVVLDKRRKVWNYLYCEDGVRHTRTIGPMRSYPTKAAAWGQVKNIKPIKPVRTAAPVGARW